MKQPAVAPIRETGTVAVAVPDPLPSKEQDLRWIDEAAELLPEELRLGWYKNVRPWIRMLPPDDEIAHLAYSMGYLALLTRITPEQIASERAKLAALCRSLVEEMAAAVKTTATYHQRLGERLNSLPGEIAQGLSPDALAMEIVDGVKEQFLESGVSEAGRQLKEQGDRLRQVISSQNHALAEFRQQMKDSQSHVKWVLNSVTAAADSTQRSIDLWDDEMRRVQWIYLGLALMLGVLLGALFYWWVIAPAGSTAPRHESSTIPSASVSGRGLKRESK
jgi:hypothetical protein